MAAGKSPSQLNSVIGEKRNLADPDCPPASAEAAGSAVFDQKAALECCCDSPDVLREMIQFFLDSVDSTLTEAHAALGQGDHAKVGELVHSFKGTLAYLATERASAAAERVERSCGAARLSSPKSAERVASEVREALQVLDAECRQLESALRAYQLTANPSATDPLVQPS
jgi:HPt (histidine-containing phosphotransfer) domain-containing protein